MNKSTASTPSAPWGQFGSLPFWLPVILGCLVVLTRLPWVGQGYGADADAWRAVQAGAHLFETGTYIPSRPPGYPLPEYFLAFCHGLGWDTPLAMTLVSAVLSGCVGALMFTVSAGAGLGRALAAALALTMTPAIFVASITVMDYLWGMVFFLIATLFMRQQKLLAAAVFLGLAAASRPTYAAGVVPLALLFLQGDFQRLRRLATWRALGVFALLSGAITLALFVPVIQSIGWRVVQTPAPGVGRWLTFALNMSINLFGPIGVPVVAVAVVDAWRMRRRSLPLTPVDRGMVAWSVSLIVLYGLLFVRLPDEAMYLAPALLGGYWLVARSAHWITLCLLSGALALSALFGGLGRAPDGGVKLLRQGLVLRDVAVQARRHCVGVAVKEVLEQPDGPDFLIVAEYRPQMMVELGAPLSERILYTAKIRPDGRWIDAEKGVLPAGKRMAIIDRAVAQQTEDDATLLPALQVVHTRANCPD
ncbi:hypothetical protein EV672_10637 [Aquabacterium commune]|uniref:Dolichyl-phosphate-mannose-protein mannosyltransferase n=1 Tax=Aquabacterium commune TaxID=70586 RepID=A0A4R6R7W8_9BURK|nr:hypothetical protein EV672_10637 [Aquabacterium commune]